MIPQENAGSGIQSVPQGEPNSLPVDPENIGSNPIGDFLAWFGNLGIFFWQVVRAAVTPPFEFAEFFRQMDEIGSKSLPLVALAGAA
ncbi:MAG: hypothetical protein WCC95_07680, partial [Candidatus Sulfotelmatobacter sp.]